MNANDALFKQEINELSQNVSEEIQKDRLEHALILYDNYRFSLCRDILSGLNDATQGHLSSTLVPLHQLQQPYLSITKAILPSERLAIHSPRELYQSKVILARNHTHFHLLIQVPVTSRPAYQLFQLQNT